MLNESSTSLPSPPSSSRSPIPAEEVLHQSAPSADDGGDILIRDDNNKPLGKKRRVDSAEGEKGDGKTTEKVKLKPAASSCLTCRKMKMRCVQNGPGPCRRCSLGGYECLFTKSMRGRKGSSKVNALEQSLKLLEGTLNTVLQSLGNPAVDLINPDAQSLSPPEASTSQLHERKRVTRALSNAEAKGLAMNVPGNHQILAWEDSQVAVALHTLPNDAMNPLGLLAESSLHKRKTPLTLSEVVEQAKKDLCPENDPANREELEGRRRGIASADYFLPGPVNILPLRRIAIEQWLMPELLINKIVNIDEVVELFDLFFTKCHPAFPILDRELHTPRETATRSPFLFTCICTVASRYYTQRTDGLYRKCLKLANRMAFDTIAKCFKSPEIVQGFVLLCQWNAPGERFEEEQVYQFSGIAIRMAVDINLNRKTATASLNGVSDEVRKSYEREVLNRERTWLFAYVLDRSISASMGKMYSITREDAIIRGAKGWYLQPSCQETDLSASAMVELHQLLGPVIETLQLETQSPEGTNPTFDQPTFLRSALSRLDEWRDAWVVRDPQSNFDLPGGLRSTMRKFFHSYYRLLLLSYAVQHAVATKSQVDLGTYCGSGFQAAADMIISVRDHLVPEGHFRYACDNNFVYLSYACCFLLKLLSPAFVSFIDGDKGLELVEQGAHALKSVAVDETHTPALYGSFLKSLLESRLDVSDSKEVVLSTNSSSQIKRGEISVDFGGLPAGDGIGDKFEWTDNTGFWSNMWTLPFAPDLDGILQNTHDPWGLSPDSYIADDNFDFLA